jgi:site-specific recombinase XerC
VVRGCRRAVNHGGAAGARRAGTRELAAPSVKQRLAAIRHLFDWLVTGQVVPVNPAGSVRGPRREVWLCRRLEFRLDLRIVRLRRFFFGDPIGVDKLVPWPARGRGGGAGIASSA